MGGRGFRVLALLGSISLGACGDSSATADGTGTGSGSGGGSGGTTGVTQGGGESGGTGPGGGGPCQRNSDCDDQNDCTVDQCQDGTCQPGPVQSNACRPQIDVDTPDRAATLLAVGGDPTVMVTGKVHSGAGPIASLTLNGEDVDVAADGSFSHPVQARTGGNILVFHATDVLEVERTRVQSFLWSTAYDAPTMPPDGMATEGLAFYLSQQVLDDNDTTLPANDLATLLGLALANFDLSQFIDSSTPITSSAGYDVYLTSLNLGSSSIDLVAIDGGLRLSAALQNITGDLLFDCTTTACQLAGGDSTGGMSVSQLQITADVNLTVAGDHTLHAEVTNVQTDLNPNDVDIWSDNGWTNFLLSIIKPFIIDGVVTDIANELDSQVQTLLAPALESGLSALALDTSLDFPSLSSTGDPIAVHLTTDFQDTDFEDGVAPPNPSPPQGGVIDERGGAYHDAMVTPYTNLGVPVRDACGAGSTGIAMPRQAPLEIGLTDDLLNQILHAAWRGGLLEFDGSDVLGGSGGGGLGVNDLQLTASGMLAPTGSDCNDQGQLLTQIGDLRMDASLQFFNRPMTFVAYSTITLVLEVTANDSGIALAVTDVKDIQTELTVMEDDVIDAEPAVTSVLQSQLKQTLLDSLGPGGLGSIALPEIDISAQLGLPPGTAVVQIHTDGVTHADGVTVVAAHL